MATSGSFATNIVGNFYCTFYWERVGQNRIYYSLTAHNTPGNYRNLYLRELIIDGYYVLSVPGQASSEHPYYDGNVIISGEIDVSTTFSASYVCGVGSYPGSNCAGSGSWTVDPVVTTPTVTCSASRGLNTITANMSVTNNGGASIVDRYIDLFTDNSCTNKVGVISGSSGTFTGLNPNTTYYARANASNGTYRGYSSVISVKTYDIAKITSSHDFNLGDNESIQYSNPSGSTIKLSIQNTDGTSFYCQDRTVTGSSYTFNFTDQELDTLYKAMGTANSINVRVYLKTFYSQSGYYTDYKQITITLTGNQKTGHININDIWKRTKKWLNVNGVWKRCVRWVNVNGTWKRCI